MWCFGDKHVNLKKHSACLFFQDEIDGKFTLLGLLELVSTLYPIYIKRKTILIINLKCKSRKTVLLIDHFSQKTSSPRTNSTSEIFHMIELNIYNVVQLVLQNPYYHFSQKWKDELLTWNPDQYNVSSIVVSGQDIWTPDIYLGNK